MRLLPWLILLVPMMGFNPTTLFAGGVLPLTLSDLTGQAGKIFVGRCVEASRELDESGLPSLWIRYEVQTALKGVTEGESVWIKRYARSKVVGCRPGTEFLLFLYPDSLIGFTSPVGLGQGEFSIEGTTLLTPYPHLAREIGELPVVIEKIRGMIP